MTALAALIGLLFWMATAGLPARAQHEAVDKQPARETTLLTGTVSGEVRRYVQTLRAVAVTTVPERYRLSETQLPVGPRSWQPEVQAAGSSLPGDTTGLPGAVALAAAILAVLIAALVYNLVTGRARARALVQKATADLAAAEAASRQQADLLTAILDSISDGVCVVDTDGAFLLHNPAAKAMLGMTDDVDDTSEWQQHYGMFQPDGRTPFQVEDMPLMRALAGESSDQVEIVIRNAMRPDGTPISVSGRPLHDATGQIGAVAVFHDITARKAFAEALRSERELLAGVLATIPHVVFWKDPDHRYLGCNEAYARLRGLEHEGQLTGRRETDLDSDPLGAFIAEMEVHVMESGASVVDHTITVPTPDGQPRIMMFSLLPRYTDGPTPGGVIGVGADLTRMTALERQLATATRLESIGQLAAGLAHEINTPIQYVSDNTLFLADSFTDVLEALGSIANEARGAEQEPRAGERRPTVEELRARLRLVVDELDLDFLASEIPEALQQTLEGVGRVSEIVRAMKEFSHPGQGRVEADVNRAVESTVQVCRNEWKYVAEMHLDLDPDLGLVPCYEGELKQVILNVIVNAAHAIADKRDQTDDSALGGIGVTTRREGELILISITDTGTGMDETTRQRIFDPFFTTKEVGKGTGQGLAMAHSCIVGRHGGSIDVETQPGAGTTFHLRLPTVAEAASAP